MIPVLSLIAVGLAIYGIVALVRGDLLIGIGSLIAAALVGPGGLSLFASTLLLSGV